MRHYYYWLFTTCLPFQDYHCLGPQLPFEDLFRLPDPHVYPLLWPCCLMLLLLLLLLPPSMPVGLVLFLLSASETRDSPWEESVAVAVAVASLGGADGEPAASSRSCIAVPAAAAAAAAVGDGVVRSTTTTTMYYFKASMLVASLVGFGVVKAVRFESETCCSLHTLELLLPASTCNPGQRSCLLKWILLNTEYNL